MEHPKGQEGIDGGPGPGADGKPEHMGYPRILIYTRHVMLGDLRKGIR